MKDELLEQTIEALNMLRMEMRDKSETRAVEVLDEVIRNLEYSQETNTYDSEKIIKLLAVVMSHLPEIVEAMRKLIQ